MGTNRSGFQPIDISRATNDFISLDDFTLIEQRLKEKPLGGMSNILREISGNRQKQGKNPIPFGSIDNDSIASRLQEAQKWFPQTYPGVNHFECSPRIQSKSRVIRNHLSRIKADESLSDQALLIFEAEVDFIDVRYREHTKQKFLLGEFPHYKSVNKKESCIELQKLVQKVKLREFIDSNT